MVSNSSCFLVACLAISSMSGSPVCGLIFGTGIACCRNLAMGFVGCFLSVTVVGHQRPTLSIVCLYLCTVRSFNGGTNPDSSLAYASLVAFIVSSFPSIPPFFHHGCLERYLSHHILLRFLSFESGIS